jgi:hypothetical protein
MPGDVPNEVVVAKLSIEAARVALESLFEKMKTQPRSEKMIATETVQEACARLKAAQALLVQLELLARGDETG